ncbi:hypothetical protein [Yoonia sp. 2307UL14-13]|uniref:hypothetical protein n=1 Tax=Yoonia sp. 2307UL14-13 TaxID=3126506 RepID=UPI0030ACBEEE
MRYKLPLLAFVALSACEADPAQMCRDNSADVQAYREARFAFGIADANVERGYAIGFEINEGLAALSSDATVRRRCESTSANGSRSEYDCLYTVAGSGNVRPVPVSMAEERKIRARYKAELDRLGPKYLAEWERCDRENP